MITGILIVTVTLRASKLINDCRLRDRNVCR